MTNVRKIETWCISLCHTLNTLRESGTFADVIIHADNGHIIRAHTCVLAASSTVLKTQLLKSQHYMDIPNISEHVWQVLLKFMYTGTVAQDVADIPSIIETGKQLQLTELVSVCEDLLKGSTHQDTCAAKEEIHQCHTTEEDITHRPVSSNNEIVNLKIDMEKSGVSSYGQVLDPGTLSTEIFKGHTQGNGAPRHNSHCENYADETSLSTTSDSVNTDIVKKGQQISAFSCNLCVKTFRRAASLRHHMSQHTGLKLHVCPECSRCFTQRSSLNRHKQIHTGVKSYSCPLCSKTFFRASHQVTHERQVHGVEKPYKCSHCDWVFSTRNELVTHERAHVEENQSSVSCTECGKTFTTSAQLVRHELVHLVDRPFACSDCPKTFRHRSNLWRHRCTDHKHTPTGGMPFECSVCRRNFRLKSSLARHEETHSNVKRHLCVVCGKRFTKQLNLAAHARTHVDKRPYKCTLCDKAFKDGSNLRRHKLTHSDEKPFLCSACGKGFYRKVDMTEHYHRKHSTEKPFKCLVCGNHFRCRRNLNRHPCYKLANCRQKSCVGESSINKQEHVELHRSLILDKTDELAVVQTVDIGNDSLA